MAKFLIIFLLVVFCQKSFCEEKSNGVGVVGEMSDAITVCSLEHVNDVVSLKISIQKKEMAYLRAEGAKSLSSEKEAEFYSDALQEQGKGRLSACVSQAKEKYLKNPSKFLYVFGKKNRDQAKRFLVSWSVALDSIGTAKESDRRAEFDAQKTALELDVRTN